MLSEEMGLTGKGKVRGLLALGKNERGTGGGGGGGISTFSTPAPRPLPAPMPGPVDNPGIGFGPTPMTALKLRGMPGQRPSAPQLKTPSGVGGLAALGRAKSSFMKY